MIILKHEVTPVSFFIPDSNSVLPLLRSCASGPDQEGDNPGPPEKAHGRTPGEEVVSIGA